MLRAQGLGENVLSRLEVRVLGGFEVWHGDQPVDDFESQKVRALLAYLILNRDSAQSREHLAGLLWPEKDNDTARRNLRQAVYNLRMTLPHDDTSSPPIVTSHHNVQFNPETDYWLDVEAFETGVRRGLSSGGVDALHLVGISELYRGDFLAGFYVSDSPDFEHWLVYEQERLREMAIQTLRRLVEYCLASGAYAQGIRYARRLLEIDSLFEEAHRNLMRLYALSGRRGQALAQYESCQDLLQTELGMEPLEETTALYLAIQANEWPARSPAGEDNWKGPNVPFVGRQKAYTRLRRSWETARQGSIRLTLVEGEAGIGKTRLIETAVHEVVSQSGAVVLCGRCYESSPRIGYQPLTDALQRAAMGQAHLMRQALVHLPSHFQAGLARLVPELRAIQADAAVFSSVGDDGERRRQPFESIARLLEALVRSSHSEQTANAVVLFLDDLHWADSGMLELLPYLIRRLDEIPIWIVGAYRPEELGSDHPLQRVLQQLGRDYRVDQIALDRLNQPDVESIAAALLEDAHQVQELTRFLDRESGGLPLTINELINALHDDGILVAREAGRWTLAGRLPTFAAPASKNLHHIIMERVSQLPSSARRLLTLAAVVGPQFDAELLQEAAGEHMAVVDAGLDIGLGRRLVRHAPQPSTGCGALSTERQGPSVRWNTFEFTHDKIRLAIYRDVSPQRRQVMHQQIVSVLEGRYADDPGRIVEVLAHHCTQAKMWDRAFSYHQQAGDKAQQSMAREVAHYHYEQALEALDVLEADVRHDTEKHRWLAKRFEILAARAEIHASGEARNSRKADLESMQEIAEELDDPDRLAVVASAWNGEH